MADTLTINVRDIRYSDTVHVRIPVIGQTNPCFGYDATEDQIRQLMSIPNYEIRDAATGVIINGHNLQEYFPGGGGGGEVTSYSSLTGKPAIDNHTLMSGNNASSNLGLQTKLTTAQLAAVNSGITDSDVTQIQTNKNNILITALDIKIPLTFEMTGTQYESFTVAVADDNNLTNVEYYENVDPTSTLYVKPHYPNTYVRVMNVSGVYINTTYPVDANKVMSGTINRQSTFVGIGKDMPNCILSVAVGYDSESSCTGEKNTAVGVENLIATTGVRNTSIGYHALYRCTSGTDNASIGAESGDDTTTGIQNTALGAYSLQRNAVGSNNTAVGFQALKGGQSSFTSDAEFNGNTVVGVRSMKNMTAGNYNTAIGYQSLPSSSNRSGCIAIGANADCTKDNQMVLGSSSITEVVFCGDKKINFNNDGTVTWEQIT